jgi:hypothetical protein
MPHSYSQLSQQKTCQSPVGITAMPQYQRTWLASWGWICSDDSGHIWEEIVPHLSCELKPLNIKVLNFEIQQTNTKLNPSNPFKVKGP